MEPLSAIRAFQSFGTLCHLLAAARTAVPSGHLSQNAVLDQHGVLYDKKLRKQKHDATRLI